MNFSRVTVSAASTNSLRNIESAASRLAKLQQQLSSGQQITTPSDDPAGTVQALRLSGELSRTTQYQASANDALAWLSSADHAYSQVVTVAQQARTLVVQALNTGAAVVRAGGLASAFGVARYCRSGGAGWERARPLLHHVTQGRQFGHHIRPG